MAYPSDGSDPIRKDIIGDVKTALEAIASGATYRTDVAKVEILGRSFTEMRDFPSIVIAPPTIEYDDSRYPMTMCRMLFSMTLAVRDRDTTEAFNAVYDFVEDVKLALQADVTRGGDAVDTHVIADEPFIPDVTAPILGCDVSVSIDYRHRRSDPAAAL